MSTIDEQHRKLFIGGLSYKTTKETLHEYYEQWGELVDSVVMQDKMTAKSRGFGFVTYRHGDALEKAMSHRPHVIDEKRVDPKRAIPKEMGKDSGKMDAYMSVRKIFVGGIRDKPITEDDLKAYFSQYGDIKDCVIMTDKTTQKSRGFAFVVFDDYDSVDKIVIQRFHIINGVNVEVKKAIPKEDVSLSRPVVYHSSSMMGSRAMPHYPYPGYGHGGWGTGAYTGAPILSASTPNIYGFSGYPATSAPPFGGFNPRDLPTYGEKSSLAEMLVELKAVTAWMTKTKHESEQSSRRQSGHAESISGDFHDQRRFLQPGQRFREQRVRRRPTLTPSPTRSPPSHTHPEPPSSFSSTSNSSFTSTSSSSPSSSSNQDRRCKEEKTWVKREPEEAFYPRSKRCKNELS